MSPAAAERRGLTKMRELLGWTIYVRVGDGKFLGVKPDPRGEHYEPTLTLERANLRDLEREIGKRSSGRVELMSGMHDPRDKGYGSEPPTSLPSDHYPKQVLVGAEPDGRFRSEDGRLEHAASYLYSQRHIDKVKALRQRLVEFEAELAAEWRAFWDQHPATKVDRHEIQRMLKEQAAASQATPEGAS